jgi:hypothetical protein
VSWALSGQVACEYRVIPDDVTRHAGARRLPGRVIVVDDEQSALRLVHRVRNTDGFELCGTAHCAAEGLALARRERPLERLMDKLGVSSKAEAVLRATQLQLIEVPPRPRRIGT